MKHGFTLLELSIVLVIIGLIIGGVTVGKDLIHAAELNATIAEKQNYQTALQTFRLKYNALAGDMGNAYAYWGADCGANTTHIISGCNGDGDGVWDGTNNEDWSEGRKALQHLSLAGMVDGRWPGGPGGANLSPSVNVPLSALGDKSVWTFKPANSTQKNVLRLAGVTASGGDFRGYYKGIRNLDAKAIDDKMDDGIAGGGKVITQQGYPLAGGTCLLSGEYRLTSNDIECRMWFYLE